MATSSIDWQSVRERLLDQRKELFDSLLRNPAKIRLAAEIRQLDDELQVCSEHIERDRRRAATRGR